MMEIFVASCREVLQSLDMTKHERATVQAIIRAIDAMETIPSVAGMVCRAFPDADEATIDRLIEAVYDGIEYR